MRFSTIMACLELEQSNDACLRIAGDLASRFDAKLIGIAVTNPQPAPAPYSMQGTFDRHQLDRILADTTKQLADLEERFRSVMAQRVKEIEWRSAMGRPEAYVAREARAADLIVIGANDNGLRHLDPGDLVMQAGRPIFVVPSEVEFLKLKCAMVAWKDTREARRAVIDALPLLRKVEDVAVVEVIQDEPSRTEAHARVDDVAAWLGRHDINAFGRVFHIAKEEEQLDKLWQYGADFLVAGAYGHARLREWAFGGFTVNLLRHTRHCTFLAH